ncbi:MAG: SH3 domain-containing protein [Candidatus Riflebacteria bacterium]|nr:SH3 domain-containing protein [Candidatus Riflebacteria bacterium]
MRRKFLTEHVVLFLFLNFGLFPVFLYGNPFQENRQTVVTGFGLRTEQTSTVSISEAWVNIRSGPGMKNGVIKVLPRGSKGEVIGMKSGWKLVRFDNGVTGWIYGNLLTTSAIPEYNNNSSDQNVISSLSSSFSRWERLLGSTKLNLDRFGNWWRIGRANNHYKRGDYQKAYDLAMSDSGNPLEAAYLQAKCLYKLGKYNEAREKLARIEPQLEDAAFVEKIDKITKPYIDEPIVFKFGGYDTIEQFRKKKANGARVGLESEEYYEKMVDIKTWKWKSAAAKKEFDSIAGIDCSGFVQRVQQELYADAAVKWPIPSRTSAAGFWSKSVSDEVNPGYRPPPPPGIRSGDIIGFDYGHNLYHHSMIFRGLDSKGNIKVVMMGDVPIEKTLTENDLENYKGTFRLKGMDKVRSLLTA